ncbi:hypothetical protein [Streptomyces sp. NPDC003006]
MPLHSGPASVVHDPPAFLLPDHNRMRLSTQQPPAAPPHRDITRARTAGTAVERRS